MISIGDLDRQTAWDADNIDETREALLKAINTIAGLGLENADPGAFKLRASNNERIRDLRFLLTQLLQRAN